MVLQTVKFEVVERIAQLGGRIAQIEAIAGLPEAALLSEAALAEGWGRKGSMGTPTTDAVVDCSAPGWR